MMENDNQYWKRLITFGILMLVFLFTYQAIYTLFFKPQTPPAAQKTEQEKEKRHSGNVPQLMLGSFRESVEYEKKVQVNFKNFSFELSEKGAKILRFIDKKYGYDVISEAEKRLKVFPLEVYTGDPELDRKLNFGDYSLRIEEGRVVAQHRELPFRKILVDKGNIVEVKLEGLGKPLWVLLGSPPDGEAFYTHVGPVLSLDGRVVRLDAEDLRGITEIEGRILFAGEESRYFFKGGKDEFSRVVIYRVNLGERPVTLTAVLYGGSMEVYLGAKDYARLRELGLEDVLDWGMLKWLVKPLFKFLYWIYEHTGSWVIAIFVLTLIVRVFMFPLGYKMTASMLKLQEVAPRLERIKEKYKDDPIKMQEEMMKVYREVGFNPFSGCLPILLQIPIFFALYKVLIITVDLKVSSFLWVPSLADRDPFYILPLLMGLTMIIQQKLTPTPDQKQALIGYVMAVAFTLIFINFPAGLVLYWTLNNLFNILQNYLIKDVLLKDKIKTKNKKKGKRKDES